jgi:7-cyano-7-deazaguanine reductase
MALKELDNSNINKHLGQSSQYKATYDPSLLVREPRQSNRTHLDLDDDNLPFIGSDTWNAYEVSGLTDNGLPVAGVGKIVYPSDNKYIVESKSFKLYFNSFNGTKLGEDPEEVREKIALKASKDLSDLLETDVKVHVFSNYEVLSDNTTANEEWQSIISKDKPYNEYITLEDVYPIEEVVFDTYKETPELLKVIEDAPTEWVHYHSALLKSNCRVTSQPDWGDVYIDIKCDNTIDPVSLVKYIVSFRDECHFHEEICETIYKRIWDTLKPEKLAVKCLYARRGGIDINPERVSDADLLHTTLSNTTVSHIKTPKQ